MGLIGEWRASRERRQRAERYLSALLAPPDASDVDWLAALNGNRERAMQELAFARRAVGLIVAERDALDDRTASDVTHALIAVVDAESRRSPTAAPDWASRWRAYTAALAVRGQVDTPAVRLGRVLLEGAGVSHPDAETLDRAAQFIGSHRARANEALRDAFGVASLPDDVRPSALRH
jgi:hypothetical protein